MDRRIQRHRNHLFVFDMTFPEPGKVDSAFRVNVSVAQVDLTFANEKLMSVVTWASLACNTLGSNLANLDTNYEVMTNCGAGQAIQGGTAAVLHDRACWQRTHAALRHGSSGRSVWSEPPDD